MLWCGAGERCRCCGAALLSGVVVDCGVVYVSGVDAVMHVSGKWGGNSIPSFTILPFGKMRVLFMGDPRIIACVFFEWEGQHNSTDLAGHPMASGQPKPSEIDDRPTFVERL